MRTMDEDEEEEEAEGTTDSIGPTIAYDKRESQDGSEDLEDYPMRRLRLATFRETEGDFRVVGINHKRPGSCTKTFEVMLAERDYRHRLVMFQRQHGDPRKILDTALICTSTTERLVAGVQRETFSASKYRRAEHLMRLYYLPCTAYSKGYARITPPGFNTIITSLKAPDESFSSRNHVRKFRKALPHYEVVLEKDSKISKNTKEKYKSLALKARKVLSEKEASSLDSEDEEYAMAVRDFKKYLRRRGKFVHQPHDDKKNFQKVKEDKKEKEYRSCFKCGDPNHFISDCPKHSFNDQNAFVIECWSDSEEDAKKDEVCLMAHDTIEETQSLRSSYTPIEEECAGRERVMIRGGSREYESLLICHSMSGAKPRLMILRPYGIEDWSEVPLERVQGAMYSIAIILRSEGV
ncbi:zf-CCHC domain-containing protein [Tanacetum coccineum]